MTVRIREAKASVCVFDIMSSEQRPEYRHEEMFEEFIAKGEYRFFSTEEAAVKVQLDVVRKGEHT